MRGWEQPLHEFDVMMVLTHRRKRSLIALALSLSLDSKGFIDLTFVLRSQRMGKVKQGFKQFYFNFEQFYFKFE